MDFERLVDTEGVLGGAQGALRARCAACHRVLPTPAADCQDHPLSGRDLVVILAGGLDESEAAAVEAQLLGQVWDIPAEPAPDIYG